MAYATQADLIPLRMTAKDLTELTDDDNSGEIDCDIVTAVLAEASGRVDSYCRNRYVTPLQPSESLTSLVLDIAVYLLFSRRRETRISDTVQQRYDQAIGFLKDISAARASLDQPASQQTPQSSMGGPQISRRDRELVFREKNLQGFV